MNLNLILTVLILLYSNNTQAQISSDSCTHQLYQQEWPTDCFLGLKVSKIPSSSPQYSNLHVWCELNSKTLSTKSFSIYFLPLISKGACRKQAEAYLKRQKALKLLKGEFLNSFL